MEYLWKVHYQDLHKPQAKEHETSPFTLHYLAGDNEAGSRVF